MNLIFAPMVYDRIFVSGPEPAAVDAQLPPWTPMAQAGVDAFELNDAQEGIYQIVGWGFTTVDASVPAGDYTRQVVLTSRSHNYVFDAKTGKRKDVRDYFKSTGVDVQMSGFLAYMNQHSDCERHVLNWLDIQQDRERQGLLHEYGALHYADAQSIDSRRSGQASMPCRELHRTWAHPSR